MVRREVCIASGVGAAQAGAGRAFAVERAVSTMAWGEASVEPVPQTFPPLSHHHPRLLGERINQN